MARYLPKLSVTSGQCRVSRPQFPQSTHGTPGTMTPLLARKTVAFYDSGFPTEARVTSRLYEKKNAIYFFQISLFVPEIFKFLKYAN